RQGPILWRNLSRTGPSRTHSLHGQIRRPELARRDADDDYLEEGVLWDRVERRAGRDSRSDSSRRVLSRLARIARASGEARRGRDPRLVCKNRRNARGTRDMSVKDPFGNRLTFTTALEKPGT